MIYDSVSLMQELYATQAITLDKETVMFGSLEDIQKQGFEGFISVDELMRTHCSSVPNAAGVYLIIYPSTALPTFLQESVGGHFKKKNPTVTEAVLKSKWVPSTPVIYIGKAGGDNSIATLRSRLNQYMRFGMGEPVGHWGGRYIWQLSNNRSLQVGWNSSNKLDAREFEKQLISMFIESYGKLPFANLTT